MVSTLVVTPIIRPHPWSSMWPTAARAMKNDPLELTAIILLHVSGVMSQNLGRLPPARSARFIVPALLISTWSPPNPAIVLRTRVLHAFGV